MTEIKVRAINSCFEWPRNLKMIIINCSRTRSMHFCVRSKFQPSDRWGWADWKFFCTFTFDYIKLFKVMWIDSEYWVFASVTAVELFYQIDIPVFLETMMTVELQLVGLPVVVTLNHRSGMVYISSVFMPDIFYDNVGFIRLLCDFLYIFIKLIIETRIPLMP